MPKLTDLKGSENLPQKIYTNGYSFPNEQRNDTIDQYNQVNIDGDVEKLAKQIYLSEIAGRKEEDWDFQGDSQKNYRLMAYRLIANLDKFLVFKKG